MGSPALDDGVKIVARLLLVGIDHDDKIAGINMGGECWFVLAAEEVGDDRGETAEAGTSPEVLAIKADIARTQAELAATIDLLQERLSPRGILARNDPRTRVLFNMARTYGVARNGVAFMQAVEETAREQIRPLPVNIDGALSAILHDLGFLPPVGKLIFIIGRVAGVTAQVIEEHQREKPMRVRFPVVYDGPPPRDIT